MTSATLFQQEWLTYRKIVDNNYLYHREAYAALRQLLLSRQPSAFSFLDLACGDASSTVEALKGTAIASYTGVDLSADALTYAEANLPELGCAVELIRGDLTDVIMTCSRSFTIVWVGLSLHHFRAPQKLALMREVRRIIPVGGMFVVYENTFLGAETREDWLARWDNQGPQWGALTLQEWEAVTRHVHDHDFPETDSDWHSLGAAAGFLAVDELFLSPSRLFRLYAFRARQLGGNCRLTSHARARPLKFQ